MGIQTTNGPGVLFQTVETWYLVGGNAKDNLSPHGTAWLMSFLVASCPRILLGYGFLSPVIVIGRLDIHRSLAIFSLLNFGGCQIRCMPPKFT